MTERKSPSQENSAPQRWHDAVRKLPADSNTKELFVSSVFKSQVSPLIYRFMSVDEDNSPTGLGRGVYVETNLTDPRLVTPDNEIFDTISHILTTSETPGKTLLDIGGPESDMSLDLSNTFSYTLFKLENGSLVLRIDPLDIARILGLDGIGDLKNNPDRNN